MAGLIKHWYSKHIVAVAAQILDINDEQDPKTFELLHLRLDVATDLEGAISIFQVDDIPSKLEKLMLTLAENSVYHMFNVIHTFH